MTESVTIYLDRAHLPGKLLKGGILMGNTLICSSLFYHSSKKPTRIHRRGSYRCIFPFSLLSKLDTKCHLTPGVGRTARQPAHYPLTTIKSKDWTLFQLSSLYDPTGNILNANYGKPSVGAKTRGLARTS